MLGWMKMRERVKVRESITELFVHRVSVYMKDNETLNNAYKMWVEYINDTVRSIRIYWLPAGENKVTYSQIYLPQKLVLTFQK